MTPETLLACVQAFDNLIGSKYQIHLGRAGKIATFTITVEKEDCYHLMGLHYLLDRIDNRNRGRIFDDLLTDPKYRHRIASSKHWTEELSYRVACAAILEQLLDDNSTIFRFNPQRLFFHSHISAEYLLAHTDYPVNADFISDVYLFVDKRTPDIDSERFCKSIFPKGNNDFTKYQSKWTLLYKEKTAPDGTTTVFYHHKGYELPGETEDDED